MENKYSGKNLEKKYRNDLFPERDGYWGVHDKSGLVEKVFGTICVASVFSGAIYLSYEIASNL